MQVALDIFLPQFASQLTRAYRTEHVLASECNTYSPNDALWTDCSTIQVVRCQHFAELMYVHYLDC